MRFQKGQSGNPAGRPRGSFGLASVLAAEELQIDAYAIIRSTIEAAKKGNVGAQRICWQRLDPAPKGSAVMCELPPLRKPSDSADVVAAILASVAAGQISTEQGRELADLVETYVRMRQTAGGSEHAAEGAAGLGCPAGTRSCKYRCQSQPTRLLDSWKPRLISPDNAGKKLQTRRDTRNGCKRESQRMVVTRSAAVAGLASLMHTRAINQLLALEPPVPINPDQLIPDYLR